MPHAHPAVWRADLRKRNRQLLTTLPADPPGAPQRPPAPGCRAPPHHPHPRTTSCPTPPPHSNFDYLSYSLNLRIKARLPTPIPQLPNDAPTDLAVELNVAKDVLDVKVDTWRVPHT